MSLRDFATIVRGNNTSGISGVYRRDEHGQSNRPSRPLPACRTRGRFIHTTTAPATSPAPETPPSKTSSRTPPA
ncbi:hypothetical protein C8238_02755 [Paracidovorax avenae]|nr:hypothetical protein C8238_02755 [Paracidovorax avenae]